MLIVKAVGRFLVATAAGAGLGAGAALYRRHLIDRDADVPEHGPVTVGESQSGVVGQPPRPSQPTHTTVATAPVTEQDIAALQASVADLEAARARLRERAAALRAEMEDSGQ